MKTHDVVVFDPFAWNPKANAEQLGRHRYVKIGRVAYPYYGAKGYGERATVVLVEGTTTLVAWDRYKGGVA